MAELNKSLTLKERVPFFLKISLLSAMLVKTIPLLLDCAFSLGPL